MRRLLLGLVLARGAMGCLALPGVQVATGIGVREGTPPNAGVDSPGQLRVGVHPLQVLRSYTHRSADFGAGYLLDYGGVGPKRFIQGAYAEGSYVFLQGIDTCCGFPRLSARAQARWLIDGDGQTGAGAALQLTGEWAGFTSFAGAGSNSAGAMWGEGSIGFYLESAYGNIAGQPIWTGGIGLIIRTPATAIIVAPK